MMSRAMWGESIGSLSASGELKAMLVLSLFEDEIRALRTQMKDLPSPRKLVVPTVMQILLGLIEPLCSGLRY